MKPGRPSWTARHVAVTRSRTPRIERPYGDPEADRRLGAALAAPTVPMARPAMFKYIAARTRFMDEEVVRALDDGFRQVAIVGAGYDGRSLRYAKPGVRFFEVDHPDTQRDKRERLDRLGIDARHVTFVAADFATDDLAEALGRSDHDPIQATQFVLEGVTGYLARDVLARLLVAMRARVQSDGRLAVNFRLRAPGEPWRQTARRRILDVVVSALGEPPTPELLADDVRELLSATGWEITRAIEPRYPRFVGAQASS